MNQTPTRTTGKPSKIKAYLATTSIAFALPALCLAWPAKVISVTDGDTIKVLHDGRQERFRQPVAGQC